MRPSITNTDAVSIRGVTKSYPGVLALKPVDLDISPGTIHAFVGENGAGKSTLLKIIAGAQSPTAGEVRVYGEELPHTGPRAAQRLGVMAVYQELTVLPNLTALENVFLGQTPSRGGVILSKVMRSQFAALLERMGVHISADARAGTLSVADQQVLEIMRALHVDARVLLLDEPTASLAKHEREALGRVMSSLASEGVTIIWISHDLDEVLELSHDVSVFREGTYIETRPAAAWSKGALVAGMLGGRSQVVVVERGQVERNNNVSIRDLSVHGLLDQVSFDIGESEIVGIAGLVGAGRTELLRAIAGLDAKAQGSLLIDGRAVPLPGSPRAALRLGIALAPEDRKGQGLILGLTTRENLCVPSWKRLRRGGILSRGQCSAYAERVALRVGLKPEYLNRTVRNLSGGNQQKAVLGKWSDRDLRLFLVDEPTRGIDINAKAEVYRLLDEATTSGMSVLLVSSEFDELAEVCDRVLVLGGGRIAAELRKPHISEETILNEIFEVAS